MTEHTPGPWEAHHQKMDSIDYEWSLQTPTHAFLMFDFSPTLAPDECNANARLIAAAPELLDALRELVELQIYATGWENGVESNGIQEADYWHANCMESAKAAIAKAEGHPSR